MGPSHGASPDITHPPPGTQRRWRRHEVRTSVWSDPLAESDHPRRGHRCAVGRVRDLDNAGA